MRKLETLFSQFINASIKIYSGATFKKGLNDLTAVYDNTESGDLVVVYPGTYDIGNNSIQLKDGVNWQFIGNPTISSDSANGTFTDSSVTVSCLFLGNANILNTSAEAIQIEYDSIAVIGGMSLQNVIDLSYDKLAYMISNSLLLVGQSYKITDYSSVHTIPTTSSTNTPSSEPLIVKAVSNNLLSPIAFSPTFPKDIIYYNYSNDQSIVPGCTKGYIFRRIDSSKKIDIGYDWRNVKFRRWQISVTNEDSTGAVSNWSVGDIVLKTSTNELYVKLSSATSKLFTSVDDWSRFQWDNLTYVSPTITTWVINSSVSIPCSSSYLDFHTFNTNSPGESVENSYDDIYNVTILANKTNIIANSNSVVFCDIFFLNTIGTNFYNNTISNGVTHNNIGSNFINNSVSSGFFNNTIKNSWNVSAERNTNNLYGAYFSNNLILGVFNGNIIAQDFNRNEVMDGFKNNVTPKPMAENKIGRNFQSLNLSSASIIGGAYPKWWFKTPDGTKKLYYFVDSTFAQTVADLTA